MRRAPSAPRFLLDEDLPGAVAVIARASGIDAVSVHEVGRTGLTDEDQLTFAAHEARILVTRNRNDFIALTKRCYATNQPHHGVLLVPRSLPNHRSDRIASALAAWAKRYEGGDPGMGFIDFL